MSVTSKLPTEVIESMPVMSPSFTDSMDCMTRALASCSVNDESNWTFRSAPFWASVVFSSTWVPVWPCTAARVTIDRVSSMISDRRLTDWLDPEPLSPLRMSEIAGDHPMRRFSICGPAAPILESTRAPPIHRKKGPSRSRTALRMKFPMIPLLPHLQKPPLDCIQLSM